MTVQVHPAADGIFGGGRGAARTALRERDRRSSERAARAALLEQIARLEAELAGLFTSAFTTGGVDITGSRNPGGARVLDLAQAEAIRDDLAERVAHARAQLAERADREEGFRLGREALLLDPAAHREAVVRTQDVGEPGCCSWHVRPKWGPIGRFMNWWRVVVSSGCPLAGARLPG